MVRYRSESSHTRFRGAWIPFLQANGFITENQDVDHGHLEVVPGNMMDRAALAIETAATRRDAGDGQGSACRIGPSPQGPERIKKVWRDWSRQRSRSWPIPIHPTERRSNDDCPHPPHRPIPISPGPSHLILRKQTKPVTHDRLNPQAQPLHPEPIPIRFDTWRPQAHASR